MYTKNRSFIYGDVQYIFEQCGEETGIQIMLEVKEVLESIDAFDKFSTEEIRDISRKLARSFLQTKKC